MLPLDLHVLSLPLAFILSQDQTLHCIFYFICLACPELSCTINFSKEINACTLFLVLINCTCSSLFQSTFRFPFESGCKDIRFFLNLQIFSKKNRIFLYVFQKTTFHDTHRRILINLQFVSKTHSSLPFFLYHTTFIT